MVEIFPNDTKEKMYRISVLPTLISEEELKKGNYEKALEIALTGEMDYCIAKTFLADAIEHERYVIMEDDNIIEGIIIPKRIR